MSEDRLVCTITHHRDGTVEYINHTTGDRQTIAPGEEVLCYARATGGCAVRTIGATLLLLLVLVIAGCAPGGQNIGSGGTSGIYYNHDATHHVSCWVYSGYGISCLPDIQVTMP